MIKQLLDGRVPGSVHRAYDRIDLRVGRYLVLAVVFFLAAIVQTWPMILHPTHLMDSFQYSGDTYQAVWNLWWVKYALVNLHTNPLHTDFLFYPDGIDLHLHTL